MSTLLATAANLATDVAGWMARADLTANIPTYIVLAEAKLNRLLRSLEHEVTNPAFMISGEYVPVPSDFLEFKSGYVNGGNPVVPLVYLPGDLMPGIATDSSIQYFTIAGTNFRFAPAGDGSGTAHMSYFAKLPTLSGVGAAYNWLLQQHPDAYLYGTLLEAAADIGDNEAVAGWRDAYTTVVQQIKAADRQKRYGGNGMAVRVA
jgi:hypothetical protein